MANDRPVINPQVGVYIRISPREKNDESLSLQNQEIRCREHVNNMPGVISPGFTIYCDEHLSGKLPFQKPGVKKFRPALTRLVQDIEAGKLQIVIVYRFDRFTRNLRLWAELVELCQAHKVKLISEREPLDVNTIEGRMSAGMLANVAEFYVNWTSQNISDVLRQKKQQGYRAGAPPYGWRWSEARDDGHRLVERDEDEGKVVVEICEKIRSGWNFSRLCEYLKSQGVKSPSGATKWWPDVVKRIAMEPFNAGLTVRGDGSIQPGKHWDIRYLDPEYHQQVVAEVKRLGRQTPITRWSTTHLLMPKLRCASCGERLYVDKREDHRHRVYWCKNKSVTRGHSCVGARAKIAWADGVVVRVIRKLSEDDRVISGAEAIIESQLTQNTGKLKQEKAKIEQDLRADLERLAAMVEKLADREVADFAYKAFEEKVEARNGQRTARLREIDSALASGDSDRQRIQGVKSTLRDFSSIWENLTIDEQRKAIDLLIEDLRLSQTHLIIKPYFADAVEVVIPTGRFREGTRGEARGLSRRELAILKLLGDGLTPKQIAERTGLAVQTVYGHVSRIYSWLGVSDIASAVELAKPVIEANDDLPTDQRLNAAPRTSDEPSEKMLTVLRAVAEHESQADAYRALGIPYINGQGRLRALMKKVGVGSLDELLEVVVQKGWTKSIPQRRERGLAFTEAEAEMVRAYVSAGSIAAAGRSLGLSAVAANSRMHTVYVKLGAHGLKEAMARMRDLGLDPNDLPVLRQAA